MLSEWCEWWEWMSLASIHWHSLVCPKMVFELSDICHWYLPAWSLCTFPSHVCPQGWVDTSVPAWDLIFHCLLFKWLCSALPVPEIPSSTVACYTSFLMVPNQLFGTIIQKTITLKGQRILMSFTDWVTLFSRTFYDKCAKPQEGTPMGPSHTTPLVWWLPLVWLPLTEQQRLWGVKIKIVDVWWVGTGDCLASLRGSQNNLLPGLMYHRSLCWLNWANKYRL